MASSRQSSSVAVARRHDLLAFRTLFSRMPEALLVTDNDRRYVEANPAAGS